jgi:hypothetical protein
MMPVGRVYNDDFSALMETSATAQMARFVFVRYGNYVCTYIHTYIRSYPAQGTIETLEEGEVE